MVQSEEHFPRSLERIHPARIFSLSKKSTPRTSEPARQSLLQLFSLVGYPRKRRPWLRRGLSPNVQGNNKDTPRPFADNAPEFGDPRTNDGKFYLTLAHYKRTEGFFNLKFKTKPFYDSRELETKKRPRPLVFYCLGRCFGMLVGNAGIGGNVENVRSFDGPRQENYPPFEPGVLD